MVKSSTDSFGFDSDKHYFQAVIPGWSLDNWPPFDRAGKAPDFFADAVFYIALFSQVSNRQKCMM